MLAKKALAGTAGAPKVYVEDVFSTYLYTGTGANLTITNNIDLSTEGGLVWLKKRGAGTGNHQLYDTVRGATNVIYSDLTNAQASNSSGLTSFSSNGFSIGTSSVINGNGDTQVAWTFRKAKKFFDVVTYTGNGSSNRQISHNLGSVPGCVIVKRTDSTGNWPVYHRMLNGGTNPEQYAIYLNLTNDGTGGGRWANTAPTSTQFSVNNDDSVNANGGTYVAYLFAHDAGGFGDAGDQSIIKCGSYTGNGSTTGPTVTLDWEPQWVMIKDASGTGNWCMFDSMRGLTVLDDKSLYANDSSAEDGILGAGNFVNPTATGFNIVTTNGNFNDNGNTFIYIAIRRGPMETPTSGTSVYTPIARSGNSTATTVTGVGFAPDLVFEAPRTNSGGNNWVWFDRLRGGAVGLSSDNTGVEFTNSAVIQSDSLSTTMDGFRIQTANPINASGNTYIYYPLRRAPGFFDVVCYTGTGANRTVSHGLGVTPELMIVKTRGPTVTNGDWAVYNTTNGNTKIMYLNATSASATSSVMWNNTSPTSSVFTVGTDNAVNYSGDNYVAYLFASVSGVSKVGSYTGNGSSVTVTTDFQPRFVMVKRYDSTGNWIVGDSARGLVSADEPALFLNSTAAETTGQDWVDVSSTGFTVNETALNANVNTGTYIYLAIA